MMWYTKNNSKYTSQLNPKKQQFIQLTRELFSYFELNGTAQSVFHLMLVGNPSDKIKTPFQTQMIARVSLLQNSTLI